MSTNEKRPNIIMITADQWRGDCLGGAACGHPVMTPHVNQLAAEGVHFTQAYADCPVCMAQRVTMLTGRVASRFGLPDNFSVRSPIDRTTSLPARLSREAGYQTKAIGKMHFAPGRARMGFEHVALHPNDYVNWLEGTPYAGMYRGHGLGGNEVYPAVAPMPEQFTHTHWIIENGIRFLYEQDPECPFFLWLVFEAPHSPFDPPAPFDRMYDNFTIPTPLVGDWVDTADDPPMFRERRILTKLDQLSPELIRESRRRYYGVISHIDYQLGRLLGELQTRGLYDNTVILFNADHGEHLGDHRLWGKTTYLRGSGDVPFVLRLPPSVTDARPGLQIDTPVLTADLHPTLLELAGLEPSPDTDGISLLPAIRNGGEREGRIVCGEYGHPSDANAFATDGRWKYVYYSKGGVEHLFDLATDRANLHNLARDPRHQEVRDGLRRRLIEYLAGFSRPLVQGGGDPVALIATDPAIDEARLRSGNPWAWRGPMRYGRGYGGNW